MSDSLCCRNGRAGQEGRQGTKTKPMSEINKLTLGFDQRKKKEDHSCMCAASTNVFHQAMLTENGSNPDNNEACLCHKRGSLEA